MKFLDINKRQVVLGSLALLVGSFIFSGCDDDTGLPERSYELVWSDEFDGDAGTLPSASNWTYDLGTTPDGWGNQELQNYTNDPANVSLDGEGNLMITAISSGSSFTSARIKTQGLQQWTYGRFEARIKTPYGPGIWPAFWLLGADIETVGWPQTGEIDVMELRGQIPNEIAGSVHGPGYSAGNAISTSFELEDARFDTDFYIYAIEWGENYIDFFVNDRLYQRITPSDVPGEWVYDHDFFILLNVAVGGTYVGFPTADTPFPQTMYVDYVRVYSEVE